MNSDYWKGPAEVIGKDNHQVIVKHGGSLIRVHPISLHLVEEQVTCRDMASETERIVKGEEDNADDNQRDENMDTSDVEEVSAENADVIEAPNNENAQQDTDVMAEVRSSDTHQGTKDSVIEQQRTEATSSRSSLPKVKTRIEYKQKGTGDVWQEAVVLSRARKASGTNKTWLNVQNIPQEGQLVNFDLIDWKYKEEAVLMSDSVIHQVAEAKH